MRIKVETGVPMPAKTGGGRPAMYPWKSMQLGESFFVANPDKSGGFRSSVSRAGRLYERKFAVRIVEGGLRVWRVR